MNYDSEEKPKKPDEEIAKILKTLVDYYRNEDRATRDRQLRQYRRLKLYWNTMGLIYWSESAGRFQIDTPEVNDDQAFYDKPLNVFRALIETVIAALSIQVPGVICVPEDADSTLDTLTSKTGNKVAERICKNNDHISLWLKTLYVWATEGMVACYHYPKTDAKFGTIKVPKEKTEKIEGYQCPGCGEKLPDAIFEVEPSVQDEELVPPDSAPEFEPEMMNEGGEEPSYKCPACAARLDPSMSMSKFDTTVFDGYEDKPKTRMCLEVYGGLYVKIPNYACNQSEMPYLGFSYETHYVNVLDRYPFIRKELLSKGGGKALTGVQDTYAQSARLNPQYVLDWPEDNTTVHNYWFRPKAFYYLPENECNRMMDLFPEGVKVVFADEICAEYEEEKLDDRWTLTVDPLSDYLTHQPLGERLTNVQDIISDLISLTLQLIEHGIQETWADPAVVNFEGRSKLESNPGAITAVKPQGGSRNISDAFFSTSAASVAPEIFSFFRIVQELGQFVSAAMPSLFGGSQVGRTSQTASEYSMSKDMALQRLQTPWRMFNTWWKTIFMKVIPQEIDEITEDEKFVERDKQGNFVNVLIRKSELGGKIGEIILDPSDQMPISEDQKKDLIMGLFELNNMEIMTALTSPENLPMIRKVTRIPDFKLPGEDDRLKQWDEINLLLNEKPEMGEVPIELLLDPNMPPPPAPMASSVHIEPLADLHPVHAEICRGWIVSPAGILAKTENPEGYQNVLLHMSEHLSAQQMLDSAMNQASPEGESTSPQGEKNGQPKKPKGEQSNVPIG